MKLEFKSAEVFRNFTLVPLHFKMQNLLLWLGDKEYQLIVTSAYRRKSVHKNDPRIHRTNPLRAIDLRSWNFGSPFVVAGEINEAWEYDLYRPKLMCCVYHDVGLGKHFHLQVHENTRLRGGEK